MLPCIGMQRAAACECKRQTEHQMHLSWLLLAPSSALGHDLSVCMAPATAIARR